MRPSTAMSTSTAASSSSSTSRTASFSPALPSARRRQHRRSAPVLTRAGAANTWGTAFRVTTFGESHGKGVGCVIDGVPPRLRISKEEIQAELDRRRPGQSRITTPRKESDTCEIYSGAKERERKSLTVEALVTMKLRRRASEFFSFFNLFLDLIQKESIPKKLFNKKGVSPDGVTLGTPICVMVPNTDQRSGDYSEMSAAYRPSHADATYDMK